MTATATEQEIAKFGVTIGDVVFTKDSETADDIGIAAYVAETLPGTLYGYHLSIARPLEGICGRFVKRLFDSKLAKSYLATRANGLTRVGLGQMAVETLPFPVPPLAEQQAIAAFLDRETAKLDALVEEQRRLIALLKEKRGAVISHAVTLGLDLSAPLKPSGIDWLGDIPAHWEVRRIKDIARMESGHTPDRKRPEYWDGDIPWVSLNDTGYLRDHDYISETKFTITPEGIANSSARLLPARIVVFSRDATIGRCAITTQRMAVSQHFIAWVCSERILPEYLLLNLRAMAQELDRLTFGATIKTIGMPDVRRLAIALPEIAVQHQILSDVGQRVERLDALTAEATRAIALLQERRAALISAAVTGKIDVRESIQTRTPEEAA